MYAQFHVVVGNKEPMRGVIGRVRCFVAQLPKVYKCGRFCKTLGLSIYRQVVLMATSGGVTRFQVSLWNPPITQRKQHPIEEI